jgi:hypothetical protein
MKHFALTGLLLATAIFGAAIARGDIGGDGHPFVVFNGGFAPHALPRDRDVPVTVRLNTAIKTVDGSRPPQLRRITLEINRYGRISTNGLPACSPAMLETTDSATALDRCGDALVGNGRLTANVEFPNRAPFAVHGRMLAFNGVTHGRPAILLHIHGSQPADVTVVLSFSIHHPAEGKFGTVLKTRIPRLASDLGYVTKVSMAFDRTYRFRGEEHSFLSARCAAPAGFKGAIFSFTRGTFNFAGGTKVPVTLTRTCRVR